MEVYVVAYGLGLGGRQFVVFGAGAGAGAGGTEATGALGLGAVLVEVGLDGVFAACWPSVAASCTEALAFSVLLFLTPARIFSSGV